MKKEKCKLCGDKGTYVGVIPPGKDVKIKCPCSSVKKTKSK